ncbi:MAG: hypothetical protein QOI59_2159 [Gammaproteobacteria bacterium]|nr:hypothetical protein [Gammaproteobacteria bacterium]
MASIDLPRALQDYFAFAETTPTRNGRRFSITLPYVRADGRLDRLQWWYHLSAAKEMALGDAASDSLRAEAVERFSVHIERWLHNTRQDLYGNGSIPYVSAEGNRVVAAFQVDPSVSEGLEQNGADEVTEPAASDAPADDVNAAEVQEAGGSTSESGHRPANKSAFG